MSGAEIQTGAGLGATRLDREDPAVRRAAVRYVATIAHGSEDLAELLDALGLQPEEGK